MVSVITTPNFFSASDSPVKIPSRAFDDSSVPTLKYDPKSAERPAREVLILAASPSDKPIPLPNAPNDEAADVA